LLCQREMLKINTRPSKHLQAATPRFQEAQNQTQTCKNLNQQQEQRDFYINSYNFWFLKQLKQPKIIISFSNVNKERNTLNTRKHLKRKWNVTASETITEVAIKTFSSGIKHGPHVNILPNDYRRQRKYASFHESYELTEKKMNKTVPYKQTVECRQAVLWPDHGKVHCHSAEREPTGGSSRLGPLLRGIKNAAALSNINN
jgi:hypothetical protein